MRLVGDLERTAPTDEARLIVSRNGLPIDISLVAQKTAAALRSRAFLVRHSFLIKWKKKMSENRRTRLYRCKKRSWCIETYPV